MAEGDLCVIFNPKAGRQGAARRLERLIRPWGKRAVLWPTERPGHGEDLARIAVAQGFSVVAAAGGDGTVHEVGNGLLAAGRHEVTFAVVPIGSANDYYHSLTHGPVPPVVDVGIVRDERGRQRYFLCCLGLGLNGAVTREARRIRRLQGLALYGLATVRALWYHYATPNMTLTLDGGPPWTAPTLLFSVLIGRREGGFVMAPEARLDDGLFDYIHAGELSRWEVLRFLPRLAVSGPPPEYPKTRQGRCREVRLSSEAPLICHIDGEFFCEPKDNVRSLEIRLLPHALRVQAGLGVPGPDASATRRQTD